MDPMFIATGLVGLGLLYYFVDKNMFSKKTNPAKYVVPYVRNGRDVLIWSMGSDVIESWERISPTHNRYTFTDGVTQSFRVSDIQIRVGRDGTIFHWAQGDIERASKENSVESRHTLDTLDRLRVERDTVKSRAKEDMLVIAEALNPRKPGQLNPGQQQ